MTSKEKIRRFRLTYEKTFYSPVRRALEKQNSSYTSVLKSRGVNAAMAIVEVDMSMTKVIRQLYVTTGLARGNNLLSELTKLPKVQKKRRTFGYNEEWTRQIIEYFQMNLLNKSVLPIAETTRDHILRILSKGVEQGWSIDKMVEEIEREDYLDGRVRRIVSTEIHKAIGYGGKLGREKFEFKTMKRWNSVHDSRTRHAHSVADGQTVLEDEPFKVGGEELDYPGDPEGSVENILNCRCFEETVAVRDSRGRLIPKAPQPQVRVRGRLRRQIQDILTEL